MKKVLCVLVLWCVLFSVHGQTITLHLSTQKTTSLIFPHPVLHVDRGGADVIAEGVPGAKHILLVKATAKDFVETNLSVVTEDGQVYSFRVCYAEEPAEWVLKVPSKGAPSVADVAKRLLDNPPAGSVLDVSEGDVQMSILGIYVQGPTMFFHLRIKNESMIPYAIDGVRLTLRDKVQAKRTAVQEREVNVRHVAGHVKTVRAGETVQLVIACEAFAVPSQQRLLLQVNEGSGARHLQLTLPPKRLLAATLLSSSYDPSTPHP